jgi:uncharacterized OB-fold protein
MTTEAGQEVHPHYPKPAINVETQPFWDGAAEGKLLLKRCGDCDKTHYYPRNICPHCFSANTEWFETAGTGRIYSFSVMRRAPVPYVIAFVTLEEGPSMMTNIVDCDFDAVAIDQEVKLTFREAEGGIALPVFTPV